MDDRVLYSFTITYFDEIDRIERTKSGFIYGSDMKDIVESLSDYFGKEDIYDLGLTYIGANSCDLIIMPNNILSKTFFDNIKKENYW